MLIQKQGLQGPAAQADLSNFKPEAPLESCHAKADLYLGPDLQRDFPLLLESRRVAHARQQKSY